MNKNENDKFDNNIEKAGFTIAYLFLFIWSMIWFQKIDMNNDISIASWLFALAILQIIFFIILYNRIKNTWVSKFYIIWIYSPFSIIYFFKLLLKNTIQTKNNIKIKNKIIHSKNKNDINKKIINYNLTEKLFFNIIVVPLFINHKTINKSMFWRIFIFIYLLSFYWFIAFSIFVNIVEFDRYEIMNIVIPLVILFFVIKILIPFILFILLPKINNISKSIFNYIKVWK